MNESSEEPLQVILPAAVEVLAAITRAFQLVIEIRLHRADGVDADRMPSCIVQEDLSLDPGKVISTGAEIRFGRRHGRYPRCRPGQQLASTDPMIHTRHLLAGQIAIEPRHHLAQVVRRIRRSGKCRAVSGAFDTNQLHRHTRGFERLLHLLGLGEWDAFILVAMQQQERRVVG